MSERSTEDQLKAARAVNKQLVVKLNEADTEIQRLRAAIATVLADAESQHPGGWGPDVTTVSILRQALAGETQ